MVQGFTFENCGKSSDPIQVTKLVLGPDPVKIPGNISLAVNASTSKILAAPIKVKSIIIKIYQSCLVASLTFASKSCGPSYAATSGTCWLYTWLILVGIAQCPDLVVEIGLDAILYMSHLSGHCATPWPSYIWPTQDDAIRARVMQST